MEPFSDDGVLLHFSFRHPCCFTCLLWAFTQLHGQSIVDRHEFFKPQNINAIMVLRFLIWYFLECWSYRFTLGHSSSFLKFFFHVIYLFSISVMFFLSPYFTPKLLSFASGPYLSLYSFYQTVDKSLFVYFGVSYFVCIVWPCSGIFWVSFLSTISSVLFCCLFVVFSFLWVPVCFTFHSNFAYCNIFLFVFLVSFPIQVLYFCSASFEEYLFYHWLVWLIHRVTL